MRALHVASLPGLPATLFWHARAKCARNACRRRVNRKRIEDERAQDLKETRYFVDRVRDGWGKKRRRNRTEATPDRS